MKPSSLRYDPGGVEIRLSNWRIVEMEKTCGKLLGTVSHPGKKYICICSKLVVSVFIIHVLGVFSGA